MKRTPLFAAHQAAGAKLIEFGGWEMPVFYTSISDEHLAVRTAAGLFDISHMGEVIVSGPGALAFLNYSLANDASKLQAGQGQYTFLCNQQGGVVDDLYAYRLDQDVFLLIVNASRVEADFEWLKQIKASALGKGDFTIDNLSDRLGAVALQGPQSAAIMDLCFNAPSAGGTSVPRASALKKNQLALFDFHGRMVRIARTGYTGEDGFELIADADQLEAVWREFIAQGRSMGLKPAGLGARDTLRTEVCYPLYGHELDEHTTPIEAGLGFFVALDKGPFIGREVLAKQKTSGTQKKLVAFKSTGRSAPPRAGYLIWAGEQQAGSVTSGTQSPSLATGIGMGYVTPGFAKPQTEIAIEIRGQKCPAMVVPKPIYKKPC